MAEVLLENVSRVYGRGAAAVDRVSLSVHDKEFVVLVGPSGCGKSTTLRMIAGLEEISSGQIRIGGRVVNQVPPKDRDIAMVFQNYALYPHMSVYKNMAFGLELRQGVFWLKRWWWRVFRPRKAADAAQRRFRIAEQVHRAAQTLGIEHLLERMPRHLSGGERQRVALGRAIVRQPAAFLFDEPLSNLDAKLRVDMRRELKQLHRRLEATVIYVTHDQVEALTLGQRIVVMNRGVVQQVGAPLDVYDRPANQFVAGFIGTPPMSFIQGELKEVNGEPRFVRGDWSLALDGELAQSLTRHSGKQLVLGIRPEDVQVSDIAGSTKGADGQPGFTATVTVVELLGDATLLNLEIAADAAGSAENNPTSFNVLSKIGARSVAVVGRQVKANLDLRRAHWFDPATGDNLLFDN